MITVAPAQDTDLGLQFCTAGCREYIRDALAQAGDAMFKGFYRVPIHRGSLNLRQNPEAQDWQDKFEPREQVSKARFSGYRLRRNRSGRCHSFQNKAPFSSASAWSACSV
jgi:hypothetical protein